MTIEIAVCARQRIVGPAVVVKAPLVPAVGIVAKPAIGAQASLVMLVAVAARAVQRGALELRRSMAPFAGNGRVPTNQRKPRDIVIKRGRSAPGDLAVTLLAFGAELALVPVVLAVTGNARRRQFVAIEVTRMTRVALDLRMAALQRISCIPVMIETDQTPFVFAVTARALGAVAPGMDILNQVTVHALRGNALVSLAAMAGET